MIEDQVDKKKLSFDELLEYRRAIGYRVYGVKHTSGVIIDRAVYMDISWECIEELADACVYLSFEEEKLRNKQSKFEARKIMSMIGSLKATARELYLYRERMESKYPELLEETLEDEIRAGNISEV